MRQQYKCQLQEIQKIEKKWQYQRCGKEAITHFKVLKRYDGFTLLEIKIDTGRTHQIRVHLSEIKHPVVGDIVYSNGKNPFGVVRTNVTCKEHRICASYIWQRYEDRSSNT